MEHLASTDNKINFVLKFYTNERRGLRWWLKHRTRDGPEKESQQTVQKLIVIHEYRCLKRASQMTQS